MKLKTLPLVLSAALLCGSSLFVTAADDVKKPTADQGTSMPQPEQGTQANLPAKDASTQMKSLDADGDGVISKAEATKMKGMTEGFDTADANKDGKLDANEFSTALSQIKK